MLDLKEVLCYSLYSGVYICLMLKQTGKVSGAHQLFQTDNSSLREKELNSGSN